jgi:hypothetical protein
MGQLSGHKERQLRQMLVAVFDTEADANCDVQTLETHGIASSDIRRYCRDDVSIPHRGTQTISEDDIATRRYQTSGGFWSWLFGETDETHSYGPDYDRDHPSYSRAVEAGQTVVGIVVEQADANRVTHLLVNQRPVGQGTTGVRRYVVEQRYVVGASE